MRHLSPPTIILLSFATIILVGTAFLLLPFSAKGEALTLVEALFTATSATCVTGLTVINIGTRLTVFGQLTVLFLIQLGGLGIMTFSTFFTLLVAHRLSIREREILHQTLSQQATKDIVNLLKMVIVLTILIEMVGAFFYWLRFLEDFSPGRAAYISIFHSVSAFCNAGFSLFRTSFEHYKGDWVINLTTMSLIVVGGLGFIVIYDLMRNAQNYRRKRRIFLAYHTRIVLLTTGTLIVGGAILFFGLEWSNAMRPLDWPTRIFSAFFQSITSRTAGFNTLNIGGLSNAALMLLSLLMLIGASPASCGGGIKTSTFTVVMAMIVARFRNEEDVNLLNRRIPQDVVSRAVAISFFSVFIISMFTLLLLVVELKGVSHIRSGGSFIEILFEAVSAFGTVGLTTGITTELSTPGRIIIIMLMYIGRLGPLTIALAISGSRHKKLPYRLAEDHVLVG